MKCIFCGEENNRDTWEEARDTPIFKCRNCRPSIAHNKLKRLRLPKEKKEVEDLIRG